jgi:hypothetical protein
MTYLTQDAIASNVAMQHRVAQCAAGEGVGNSNDPVTGMGYDPDRWTLERRRYWSASPGWDASWEYALNVHSADAEYDPGPDAAVITDQQILAQVQSML